MSAAAADDTLASTLAELNVRRARVLLPVMLVLHAAHVVVYRVPASARSSLAPRLLAWHDGIVTTHAVTLALAALLLAFALTLGKGPLARMCGPVTAIVYLVHGAVLAAVDQLSVTSITPYIGSCLGVAVIFALPLLTSVVAQAVGLATFVVGMTLVQPDASARLSAITNGTSFFAVAVALSWLLQSGRRRELAQRTTIERQRSALAELNAGLEARVADQVAEIVARAEEVSRLNAQLSSQVRARSSDLSIALARLARHHLDDGTLRRGTVLVDRFEVGPLLAAGGMGAVYSGIDRSTGSRVAIKISQASSTGQLDAWRRFLQEVTAAASLDHPAIVRVHHIDVSEDGMLFQVQELVHGSTLQSRTTGQPWAQGTVARLGAVLGDALAMAHERGVVHRDVKPSNLMVTTGAPGLKLLDFGIAKLRDASLAADDKTHTGVVLGTPIYMAPEHIEGLDVNDRADVYAVGVLLFLLLTGRPPFGAATPRGLVVECLTRPAPDVRTFEADTSAELAELVARCLSKDPGARPSATEVAGILGAFADARDVPPLDVLERQHQLHDTLSRPESGEVTVPAAPVKLAHEG